MTRIHLVGMPHNDTVRAVEWCAFSQKTRRLADMLTAGGHEVIYYGGPANEAAVAEHVVVVTDEDRKRWFGGEDFTDTVFNHWDPQEPCWAEMNANTVDAIADRLGPTDIIGITMGRCQQAIAAAFPNHVVIEPGIGYEGPLTTTHWCVESEAWRHYLYGKYGINDGRWYDTVIPNAYDPEDFDFCPDPDDYLLYLGRLTPRKGTAVVAELAKHHRVITAGQGDPGLVPGAEYRGVVVGDEKRKLLASARAVLVPTQYIGPFEGVAVEAMFSGTSVLTSPFGAFSETVVDGVNGWRCHTLGEFEAAVDWAGSLPAQQRREIVLHAREKYSTSVVARRYDAWLDRLGGLYGVGWYG